MHDTGSYLKRYKRDLLNLNRLINNLFGPPPVQFSKPLAIIVQEKRFPDVSFYQGSIRWTTMSRHTDAVVIRAGQNVWEDPQFKANWNGARQAGMKRGTYWFYDDRISPGRQAQLLADLVCHDLPEMEIWIDWETTYGGAFGGLRDVVAMMQAVEQSLPSVRVGMYTGYYWFRDHSNPLTNSSQYSYLKEKPLWLAWYANASQVLIPPPWTWLLLWQYGTPAAGEEYGVQSVELDMNYFNGTQDDFDRRYGGPPPTGEPMTQIIKGTALGTVKRRAAPAGAEFSPPRYLYAGDTIEADKNSNQWLHLTKINGAPVTGDEWASAGSTQQYIRWSWVTVTDPPPPDPEPEPSPYPDLPYTITLGDDITYTKQTIAGILRPK